MIKRFSYLLSVFAALLMIAACTDRGAGAETESSFSVSFAEGSIADSLGLSCNESIAVNGASAPLKVMDGLARGYVQDSDEYYAVYPADALQYFVPEDRTSAVMTLPMVQTAVPGSIPPETHLAAAYTSSADRNLVFGSIPVYLKFTITPDFGNVTAVSVMSAGGSRLSGDFSVCCKDGNLEAFPMANSASNVVLKPSGKFIEPGEYYIAAFPSACTDELYIAFENDEGKFAVKTVDGRASYKQAIRSLGEFRLPDYGNEGLYSGKTYHTFGNSAAERELWLFNSMDYDLKVTEGSDWLRIVQTKSVERHTFWMELDENNGTARLGQIVALAKEGNARVVYTIFQSSGLMLEGDAEIRAALIELYEATDGDNWTKNTNWCSDLPLSEWYGISTYKEMNRLYEGDAIYSIGLSYNNLCGTLPVSIGNIPGLEALSLISNKISGTVPKEYFKIPDLNLCRNSLTSIEEPENIDEVRTNFLALNQNSLSGSLPEFIGQAPSFQSVYLNDNDFTGKLPESYGSLVSAERQLYLNGNRLSGKLPEAVSENRYFEDCWQVLLFQNGIGFDLTDVRIKAPSRYLEYVYDGQRSWPYQNMIYASDIYSKNRYTLLYVLHDEKDFDRESLRWEEAWSDNGFGIMPVFTFPYASYQALEVGWPYVVGAYTVRDDYTLPSYTCWWLIDSEGYFVIDPVSSSKKKVRELLESEFGALPESPEGPEEPEQPEVPEQPEEPKPLPAPEVYELQKAEKGNGIDVVLMGDAYSVEEIENGTYREVMEETIGYFFDVEPYMSHRNLFNVYMVVIPSEQSGYDGATWTPLQCRYGEDNAIYGADDICFEYASLALPEDRIDEALVIAVLNSKQYGGSCYTYPPESGDYANGKAVAYIPDVPLKMTFRGLVQHEAGGHGFAKLADEYFDDGSASISEEEISRLQKNAAHGWWANVDFMSDPGKVKWAHFLTDERYAAEGLGVYEGALQCAAGVWRASQTSIMKDNSGEFNAPSREIIWRRINRLAYGESWEYSFEKFAEYDALNRSAEQ